MADILVNANDILIDHNGQLAYLTDNSLYIYHLDTVDSIGGLIILNNSDLNEPHLDKLLNYIEVDYKGTIELYFYFDDQYVCKLTAPKATSRTTKLLYFPLRFRRPFQRLQIKMLSKDRSTIIYNLEVDFDVLPKRVKA